MELKRDIIILEREKRGETGVKRKRKLNNLGDTYGVKRKSLVMAIEELKQSLLAQSMNIKRHGDIVTEYRQNQMLTVGQKKSN